MSHTATGEWKSFEIRMRRRRAERLVVRADVAAAAGSLDEARAALEEARALWPGAPGLADVQQKIENPPVENPPVPKEPVRISSSKELAAAGLAIAFAAAAAILIFLTGWAAPSRAAVPQPLASRDAKAIVDAMPITHRESAIVDHHERIAEIPEPTQSAETVFPEPTQSAATVFPQTETVRSAPVEWRPASVEAEVEIPARRSPVPNLPPPPIPEMRATSAASPAVIAAAEPAPMQPPPEPLVRSALARYAKAYNDLDVDAAERVWPSVNRSALERAFDSLASQRVSLGECRIDVDGDSARASCAGSATWRPKVGGGERTDERSWIFDLEKSAAGWRIVNARVQNR